MNGGPFLFVVGDLLYTTRYLCMYIYLLHIPFVLQKSISFNLMAAGHTIMIISVQDRTVYYTMMDTQVKHTNTDPVHQPVDS